MGAVLTPQRILIAGAWRWPMYEAAFARGLAECGVTVNRVVLPGLDGWKGVAALLARSTQKSRRLLLDAAEAERPDWVLLWRPTAVDAGTVGVLQASGIRVATFNNDDPFSPLLSSVARRLWAPYLDIVRRADRNFVYRPVNVAEVRAAGGSHAAVLPPYFIPWRDRPLSLEGTELTRFGTDVVFAGHYEPDGRATAIRALVATGLRVKIWCGTPWNRRALGDAAGAVGKMEPALDDDYARAISGASVALGFLSAANRDRYTRRCFEIPACGRVLLAPRTPELQALFHDGIEALLYGTVDELVARARAAVADAPWRDQIADAGRRRVWADGHDVRSRARQFLTQLQG